MISSGETYARLEQRFAEWALTRPSIAAVIVVGSRARSEHPADEWSDLDLVAFATDVTPYLQDSAWLNTFGSLLAAISNSFGRHDREWIALYADGSKLDVAWLSIDPAATPTLPALLDAFPYPNVLQRGVRVLIDKTGSPHALRRPKIDTPPLPDRAEFTVLIDRVRLDAVKAAKFIRRQDLWRAKQVCDCEMKQHLLTMLQWHAAAQQEQRDLWYDGRFLSEWADPQTVAELPATFAAYDAADLQRALFATLDLFRRLARDVARRLGYAYPADTDQFVDNYIRALW
jgi:aminoglycoside 6-adenylyltransferase